MLGMGWSDMRLGSVASFASLRCRALSATMRLVAGYNHADWLLEVLVMNLLTSAQLAELQMSYGAASVLPFASPATGSGPVAKGARAP